MNPQSPHPSTDKIKGENLVSDEHRTVYRCVLDRICQSELPFALGGGLAVGVYSGCLRPFKDLDIYILPEHRERLAVIMSECGMEDYYNQVPYDRRWIHRGHAGGVIVDAIWAMANQRAQVDAAWLTRGPEVRMFGEQFRVIPPEELIWSKLYVLQRDRCDWPDILNLIHATGPTLDWDHLLRRVEDDRPLVKGVLSIFSWLCPGRAGTLPCHVWKALDLPAPNAEAAAQTAARRKDLLDARPWLFTEPACTAA